MAEIDNPVVNTTEKAFTAVAYVGPNKLSSNLKTYTVYKTKPEAFIQSLEAEYPSVSRLFVAVEELSQAMEDVQKKGTPLYIAYHEITGGAE